MRRFFSIFAVLVIASFQASAARAAVYFFEIKASSWQIGSLSTDLPYGLTTPPDILGSITVDLPYSGERVVTGAAAVAAITDIDLQTGSRVWSIADLGSASFEFSNGGSIIAFSFWFPDNNGTTIATNNGAIISDGLNQLYCGNCVISTVAPAVPEPSTWAMLVIGFTALGHFGLRQRRRRDVVVSSAAVAHAVG